VLELQQLELVINENDVTVAEDSTLRNGHADFSVKALRAVPTLSPRRPL